LLVRLVLAIQPIGIRTEYGGREELEVSRRFNATIATAHLDKPH
jgi:hypothetical protein